MNSWSDYPVKLDLIKHLCSSTLPNISGSGNMTKDVAGQTFNKEIRLWLLDPVSLLSRNTASMDWRKQSQDEMKADCHTFGIIHRKQTTWRMLLTRAWSEASLTLTEGITLQRSRGWTDPENYRQSLKLNEMSPAVFWTSLGPVTHFSFQILPSGLGMSILSCTILLLWKQISCFLDFSKNRWRQILPQDRPYSGSHVSDLGELGDEIWDILSW